MAKLNLTRATSPLQRSLGLIGRTHLGDDEGMFFERCAAIHTLFMRMPIDVLFLDVDGRVVRSLANVPPWRPFVGCAGARSVVELAAGSIERRRIQPGDVLEASNP